MSAVHCHSRQTGALAFPAATTTISKIYDGVSAVAARCRRDAMALRTERCTEAKVFINQRSSLRSVLTMDTELSNTHVP